MTDAHTPSSDDAENDREYMLLRPEPEAIGTFLERLEAKGINVETAVVEMPSEDSPGSLSVQFWTGEPEHANKKEGDR